MGDESLTEQILKQVEYYFSPLNLPKDGFLQSKMNDALEVPVGVIAGFRKVTELTTDRAKFLEALAASDVLEVTGEEGEEMVRHRYATCSKTLTIDHVKGGFEEVVAAVGDKGDVTKGDGHGVFVIAVNDGVTELHGALGKVGKAKRVVTYTREEDEVVRRGSQPNKVKRVHKFSQALRPLLIGKHGSNIKRLQEQFPSLSIDTRYDDTSIEITAANEAVVEDVVREIEKIQVTDEEEDLISPQGAKPDAIAELQHQQQQQHQQHQQQQQQQQAMMLKYLQQQQLMQNAIRQQQTMVPPMPTVGARPSYPPHVELAVQPRMDPEGRYYKELKIPISKAAFLIGKKGAQKAKLEQAYQSLSIKITPLEHEGVARVGLTAPDSHTVMQAAIHISRHYGLAQSPPEGININMNNMIAPGGYRMAPKPGLGPNPMMPMMPGMLPQGMSPPPQPNPSLPLNIPLNNGISINMGMGMGMGGVAPPGHLASNTPPNMQLMQGRNPGTHSPKLQPALGDLFNSQAQASAFPSM